MTGSGKLQRSDGPHQERRVRAVRAGSARAEIAKTSAPHAVSLGSTLTFAASIMNDCSQTKIPCQNTPPKTVNLVRGRNALVLTMEAITKRPAATFRRHAAWKPFRRCSNVFGPEGTLTVRSEGASQRHRTGHSCMSQHLGRPRDGRVG